MGKTQINGAPTVSPRSRRALAAFIAPFAPSLLIIAASVLLNMPDRWPFHGISDFIVTLAFPALFSSPAFLLLGVPVMHVLQRKDKLSLVNLALAGAVLGVIASAIYFIGFAYLFDSPLITAHRAALTAWLYVMPWGAVFGLSVTMTYGLILGNPSNRPSRGSSIR
jgi:hypothetical protein